MSDEFEQVVLGAAPREWFDPRDGSPIIPDSWRPVLTAVEKYTADLRATIARLTAERDSLAADLEALRGRVAEAMDAENRQNHHLAAIRSVVVEFKAAGEYEFRAETAAEAFLQQKIRALLDDLYEELGMN